MIVPDNPDVLYSSKRGCSIEWTSPELLKSSSSGEGCPTKASDCYALGMVVYEVLSGKTPFTPERGPIIVIKVLGGKHPVRPAGELFTDGIWKLLKQCWELNPIKRISADGVLPRLTQRDHCMFSPFCSTNRV